MATAGSSSSKGRGRPHRIDVEERISRQREKEHMNLEKWSSVTRYYETVENKNAKHEAWTSPRYYESQNKKFEQSRKESERLVNLEKRRAKLRQLLFEEDQSYKIELTVKTRDKLRSPRLNEIPTEVLKDVNVGLKLKEEEKRQREAELALYHQWRNNNPALRERERSLRHKDLKLSWLDQQIEKRMQKEREAEECKKLLKERDERLAKLKEEEESFKKQQQANQERLRNDLEEQMEILKLEEAESERLKAEEQEQMKKKWKLEELDEARKREEERIKARELALFNIRHHKLRLQQKAKAIEENLKQEEALMKQLRDAQLADAIEDERKRNEWKEAVDQFLLLLRQQRELEKQRQAQWGFLFDSEANDMFKKQNEIWNREQAARKEFVEDVVDTVRKQIALHVEENRNKQIEKVLEREENLKRLGEYNEMLKKIKEEEVQKQAERKRELDEQVKEKVELRRRLKTLEQRNLDLELEKAKQEEERLKMEIVKLEKQKRRFPR